MKSRLISLFIVFAFSFQGFLYCQDRYVLSKLDAELNYDGVCDEPSWDKVEPLPLMMFRPVYGDQPSEKTVIKVAYDDDYLYMGAICFDSDPEKMKIQLKRDDWRYEVDWVMLILDTFNDKENTIVFATSPSGGRTDVAFSNDVTNVSKDMNVSWNTFWDVKTTTDSNGWQIEMRIPFSSLKFQDDDGEVVMGLNVVRYMSKNAESISMKQREKKHGFWGGMKATQTMEIVIKDIKSKKPLYITPYVLGGLGQENTLNDAGTAYQLKNNKTGNVGLDLKYRLTDNLTLDATINQDFAQIEADNQRVNLTRFSLFFPEKRMFFQERKSNFSFDFDINNRLFHSRRIGLYDGERVGIYGGGRLVGRLGPWDVGFLSMQSAPVEDLLSENFTVLRLRRQVINPSTYVGGIVTNRMDFNGNFNTAYGADGIFRLFGDDYLKVMLAQTFENDSENNPLSLDPTRIYLNWTRRTNEGLAYILNYSRAGADYNPGMGYEQRSNYSNYNLLLKYGWIYDNRRIKNQSITINGYLYNENFMNTTETAKIIGEWAVESVNGTESSLIGGLSYENLLDDFDLTDDVTVPAGNYTNYEIQSIFSSSKGKSVKLESEITAGTYYDGWLFAPSITPSFIIKKRVQLMTTYMFNRIVFPDRNQQLNAHIFRFNTQVVFNTKLSMSAFVQYNSTIDAVLANFRLRYNPKEGNDFYLVYDEDYNSDRYREIPTFPISTRRSLMIKYTYTFVL